MLVVNTPTGPTPCWSQTSQAKRKQWLERNQQIQVQVKCPGAKLLSETAMNPINTSEDSKTLLTMLMNKGDHAFKDERQLTSFVHANCELLFSCVRSSASNTQTKMPSTLSAKLTSGPSSCIINVMFPGKPRWFTTSVSVSYHVIAPNIHCSLCEFQPYNCLVSI